ncbi:MAG: hypothetical protein WC350_00010 [Candidatus Micrarchaeia archaeon]|jgi:hypothetical protein
MANSTTEGEQEKKPEHPLQIAGLSEDEKRRFRTLCAKEGRTSAQMFLEMLGTYERLAGDTGGN